jgi:hypothetical protein
MFAVELADGTTNSSTQEQTIVLEEQRAIVELAPDASARQDPGSAPSV